MGASREHARTIRFVQGLRVPARRATNRRREPRRSRQTQGLARPLGRYARENALYQIEAARALRAFARASLGDGEGARRDIAAVRARAGVSAESLARVSLAEAIVLERSGGRDALRALLDRDKGLLLESCHPRERAIVRASQRMVRVTTTTAYRAAPPREEEDHRGDEPLLLDRVTRIAPGAAAFVRAPRAHTGPVGPRVEMLPEARAGAHRDLLRSRADTAATVGKRSNRLRLLAAVAGVAAAFVGLFAIEAQIREWSAKLAGLIAHTDKLTAQAKLDAKPLLDALHLKIEAAKAKLHEIAGSTDGRWEEVKTSAEHAWHEVKGAVEGAHDAIMPDKKD